MTARAALLALPGARAVEPRGLLAQHPAQRLRQRREEVHGRQRRQQAGATPLSVPLKVGRHTVRGMLALRPKPSRYTDDEQRRLALLPQTAPLAWDELMHDPAYQRALERLP